MSGFAEVSRSLEQALTRLLRESRTVQRTVRRYRSRRRAEFDPTLCAQSAGVELRQAKLDEPLRQHERNQPGTLTHAQPRARAGLR